MDLTPYVENLRRELAVAAEAGGEDARALAERLTAPLESAVRLTLLDALSAAADEITRELAPGSVELRLRGGEPELRRDAGAGRRAGRAGGRPPPAPPDADEGATARINLRLPEQLKAGVEQAAGRERLSVNAWLVRAAAAALAHDDRRPPPARRPDRPGLHRLGALTAPSARHNHHASNLTCRRASPCRPSTPPNPISATIDVVVGDVRISAGDRATTVVDGAPQRRVQRRGRQGRRADPRRVRRRPAAGQGAEAALVAAAQRRRVDRRDDRAARRLARARRRRAGATSTATAGSATCRIKTGLGHIRLEQADDAEPQERRRRHHRRPRDGPRRGHRRLGRRARARARRQRGDQELQRRHLGRRGRAATCGVNAANGNIAVDVAHASVVAKSANGDVRLGEVVRGSVVLETAARRPRGRHPRGHRRLARRQRRGRPACTTRSTPPTPPSRRPRRVEVRARTSVGDIVIRRPEARMRPMTAIRDRGDRPAQVLRRPGRARRHRPRRRRGHGLRAARPERRRQDDDRPDPVDPDRAPTAARCASPATTSPREPDAVRAAIGVTGQFSAVDNLLTGEENLHPDGRPAPPRPRPRAAGASPSCSSGSTSSTRPSKPAATYSGGMRRRLDLAMTPGRRPADHLPRRADHRPGPAQPPHDVGDRSATSSPAASRSS